MQKHFPRNHCLTKIKNSSRQVSYIWPVNLGLISHHIFILISRCLFILAYVDSLSRFNMDGS